MKNAILAIFGCRKPAEKEKQVSEGLRLLVEVNQQARAGLEKVLDELIRDNHSIRHRQENR